MQNIKDTNEPIYETKIESQTQRTDWWLLRERIWGEGLSGMLGLAYISFIYRIDKQQGHTVNYREHIQYPMINNNRKNITKRMNHLVQHKNEQFK